MRSRLRILVLAPLVAVAVLVPLYGDPRPSPVTHAEWARMLLRGLGMSDSLPPGSTASETFATLSWKNSLSLGADRYLRGAGVEVKDSPKRIVATGDKEADVAYSVAVVRGGDYKLRLKMSGDPTRPGTAEITPAGGTEPVKLFAVTPAPVSGWVDAGSAHLDSGSYVASVRMPPGTSLERVEVAPPCVASVEPPGGWKSATVLDRGALSVTMLKALDKESELSDAGSPLELSGADFHPVEGAPVVATSGGDEAQWIKAGRAGLKAMVLVEIAAPGLYSVSSLGVEGGGQSWLADSCRKSVVCGTEAAATQPGGPVWRQIMTAELSAGQHAFTVSMGTGAGILKLRLDRKQDSPEEYAAALARVGFEAGPDGPVARDKAVEAMKFVEERVTQSVSKPCGDAVVTTANASATAAGAPGGGPPPGSIPGPVKPPGSSGPGVPPVGGPPVIPPQSPGSPTTP